MTSESNRTGSLGINYVTNVLLRWGWGFQSISQENDDGYDGLIYIRSKNSNPQDPENKSKQSWIFTGGLIHVQVKSGDSYISSQNKHEIKLKINNLNEKKKIWEKSPIPCVLIFVFEDDNEVEYSYWADLKSEETYIEDRNCIIKVPIKNRFSKSQECKGPLRRLARTSGEHAKKPLINLSKSDSLNGFLPSSLNGNLNYPLKRKAIDFYQKWKLIGATNPYFGQVLINRTGWSHITRKGRPIARIETSFNLLPIAARIINDVSTWRMLTPMRKYENRKDGYVCITDFVGLTAKVILKERHSSEVMVVLKRETRFKESEEKAAKETRIWFYTVYEPGRGK
ncbi:DUF4365 domain-containing protein [Yersinia enterocolitica]|uniref:DUF4365 domain-containing protein n=1 Tax=Yersinia enterocolitica TaxID=630 RepID=UPI001C67EE16|nr:DUF4365 domain-containing protein [Yersinia enterocolitica]EKN4018727.1 DUF4365 domain-containing protein [Yersinia enterocolitica]EKN5935828.1 DUF4365 domain-containing protein [Yersinia enterocolitica]MBW5861500.1 DUF4365 domain-containing protein [Yersinia enterocolitica]HDL7463882.1 DUF4365 domain-containing protein [Yersinia enterocolitica]HDL7940779.1 DUF4365 domain-containing protein [Yersinia enterocolitica]